MVSCHSCGANSGDNWLCGGSKCYAPLSRVQGTVYEDRWRRTHGRSCVEVVVYAAIVLLLIVAVGWMVTTTMARNHRVLPTIPSREVRVG